MAPKVMELKLEEAVLKLEVAGPKVEVDEAMQETEGSNQKTNSSSSLTIPHRAKQTEETATQQAASQQVKAELSLAVEAAESLQNIKLVLETGGEPSGQRVKRRYTKRMKRPLFAPYGPTDLDRQGANFRTERMRKEEEMVGEEEVDNVPGAYPRDPDRTYYPDGSRCS